MPTIVDEALYSEVGTGGGGGFHRPDPRLRVLFVVKVMLGPDWPLGVTRLLQWLETTDFALSSTP